MKTRLLSITTALAISINAFAQIPTNGLVAYYPFSGSANDLSGNNNNGTVNGATLTTDRFGNVNSAYNFTNGVDRIVVPNNNTLSLTGNFGFNFWIKIASFNGSFNSILSKMESGSCNHYGYFMGMMSWSAENKIQFQADPMCINANAYQPNSAGVLLTNQWYNIGITYNQSNSKIKYYKNGILFDSITSTLDIQNTTYDLIIGNHLTYPYTISTVGSNFDGKIDDIRIYNRELNSSEILALYNESLCFQTITVTDTLLINANITGYNPVTYQNTIKIYPNPANDHINIDYGNYSSLNGYTLKITNSLGQTVFTTPINQQTSYVTISTWTGNGIFFVYTVDGQGNTIDVKKIVLQ